VKEKHMRIAKTVLAIAILIVVAATGFVYLAPESAFHLLVNAMRAQAGLERKEIRLPDGLRYVYLEGGQGAPLMLLHGFGANKDNFTLVAGLLTKHYRVIIPDHIGFGESSHPADADYAPPAQAERLRNFAHALGVTDLHIGGNSMGGHIAMTYAALYPGDVKSLWLLDPGGVWNAPKSVVHTTIETTEENPLMVRTEEDFAALMPWVMNKPPFVPRPILNVLARERIANNALEERVFREITADSVEMRVAGLTMPTLIVWGDTDGMVPLEVGRAYHAGIAGSRLLVMEKCGHVPPIERPAEFTAAVTAFLCA